MRVTVEGSGRRKVYGGRRPAAVDFARAPVVRVLGVEAAFRARSYAPGQLARLRVSADAHVLALQLFRSGPEEGNTNRPDEMKGVAMAPPRRIKWDKLRNRTGTITVRLGDWPSGLYFARLITSDGRRGFAPFIIRPATFGATSRVAVVLPTNTWQAYNFRDTDGDGWGDTWYAGGNPPVELDRPFLNRGVPRGNRPTSSARRISAASTVRRCAASTTWSSSPVIRSTSPTTPTRSSRSSATWAGT
jgi:hypothetical protein